MTHIKIIINISEPSRARKSKPRTPERAKKCTVLVHGTKAQKETPEFLKKEMNIPHNGKATVVGFIGLADGTSPTPDLVYTDDIAPFGKYTISKDAHSITVTSPLDEVFPFCDIKEMTDSDGNVLVKFPRLWLKWVLDGSGNIDGVKISNVQADSEYFTPDAYLDPNDSTRYLPYFALGKYEASGSSEKLYSISGKKCVTGMTRASFRAAARAYGTATYAYGGYQQIDLSMLTVYNFLCMLYFKTPNIQSVFSGRTNADSAVITGSCDNIKGLNGSDKTTECVKLLGIENPFGNIFKWIDGVIFDREKILIHQSPTDYADEATNSVPLGFPRPTQSGYISQLRAGAFGENRSYVYASCVDGEGDNYSGDYCWHYNTGVVLCAGGAWGNTSHAGLWYLYGGSAASNAGSSVGGRLAYRPL